MSLTRKQIAQYLGDVDDLTAARVAGTGASEEELHQALYEARREVEEGDAVGRSHSETMAALRRVLREVLVDVQERETAEPMQP